jgi:hypothetical protein
VNFACGVALPLLVAATTAAATPPATCLTATVGATDTSPREFELQTSFESSCLGGSLRIDVLASRWRFGEPRGESAAGVAWTAPLTRGLLVEGLATEQFASGEAGTHLGLAGGRLIHAGSRDRVWAGYAYAHSAPGALDGGPVLQTAGEVAIGRLALSGSIARSTTTWHLTIPGRTAIAADTIVVLTSAEDETRRRIGNTVRLGSTWSATRWSVETMGGVRWETALPATRWLRVEGAWWLAPRLALRLGVGREVADPWQVGSTRRGASLAVEWTRPRWETPARFANVPRPVVLRVANLAGDLRRIEIISPGAARIEATGDFTMWEPVELQRSSGGRFIFELHIPPGIYRVQVRRDGGPWLIPANLPGTDDPDLGETGTLVIG